ncbi:MAG: diguanylate cyclase [Acidobacteriota bacterium]
MPTLDMKTIGIIGLVLHAALALMMLQTYLTRKTYPGFRSWTIGQACWVAASFFFYYRPLVGESLSIVVSNALYMLFTVLLYSGMARFYGFDPRRRRLGVNILVAFASLGLIYWYRFAVDDVNMRIFVQSLGLAFIGLRAAIDPLLVAQGRKYQIQAVISGAVALTSATVLLRGVLALTIPLYTDMIQQDTMLRLVLIVSLFSMVIEVCGFITLMHARVEDELLDTQARLQALADTDSLTGLMNRRKFTELAARDIGLATRHGNSLSLILFDLDHFKQVNDVHGHAAGDAVLVEVGRKCLETVRQTDIVARWGGEEFALLMPETDEEGARLMAGRLREILRELLPLDGREVRVTASFGVAELNAGGRSESFEKLAARADACLYRAKREGRDRVCTSA